MIYSVPVSNYFSPLNEECNDSSSAWSESISIEKVDFEPLVVAQNHHSVAIRLKSGKILSLNNANAKAISNSLLKKKYDNRCNKLFGGSRLNIFLGEEHGYLRLDCERCPEPRSLTSGFYPRFSAYCGSSFPGRLSSSTKGTGYMEDEAEMQGRLESEGDLRISIPLTDEQALAARKAMDRVSQSCAGIHKDGENHCLYRAIGSNCIDYVQKIYRSIGAPGHFADYFSDHQLLRDSIAYTYAFISSRGSLPFFQAHMGIPYDAPELGMNQTVFSAARFSNEPIGPFLSLSLVGYVGIGLVAAHALYKVGRATLRTFSAFCNRLG